MGDFIKIGGKYSGGEVPIAKGISVNSEGKIEIIRINETENVVIFSNENKRDTNTMPFYGADAIDLSEWTSCSILFKNELDVDVTLRLYSQSNKSSSTYLKDLDGDDYAITLIHGSGEKIITPDDFPILLYLRYFSGALYFSTAPTTGSISLSIIRKR